MSPTKKCLLTRIKGWRFRKYTNPDMLERFEATHPDCGLVIVFGEAGDFLHTARRWNSSVLAKSLRKKEIVRIKKDDLTRKQLERIAHILANMENGDGMGIGNG